MLQTNKRRAINESRTRERKKGQTDRIWRESEDEERNASRDQGVGQEERDERAMSEGKIEEGYGWVSQRERERRRELYNST